VAWLALADALEEEGDPRAELVRLTTSLRTKRAYHDRAAHEARVQHLIREGMDPCVPRLTVSLKVEMTLIPPGVFWMGANKGEWDQGRAETPRHQVTLTKPFYLSTFLITQKQYRMLMKSNPSSFIPNPGSHYDVPYESTETFPVDGISFEMAEEFCARLSARATERRAKRVYRLPTEAEWEYACRAGTTTMFHYGNQLDSTMANFDGNYAYPERQDARAEITYLFRTCPVGSFRPNAFGLYDMHGNLWEWCSDWYSHRTHTRRPRTDPTGPKRGSGHVLRGGSWIDAGWNCRSATRSANEALHYVGLRIALDAPE
jgi:formylglycine-generating enzyme required for sulfatase activity